MKYNKIGDTNLVISEIGFGTIPIMTGPSNILPRYFNLDDSTAIGLLRDAFESGITFFDTSVIPEYGDSERKLGAAFKDIRQNIVISSKARAYSRVAMQQAIESSLRNLDTDYIDMYHIHQVAPKTQAVAFDEESGALRALLDAQKKGYVREIGVGTHYAEIAVAASRLACVGAIQIPYNILETGIFLSAKESCSKINERLIFNKVLGGGILTHHFTMENLLNIAFKQKPKSLLLGVGTKKELKELLDAYTSDFSEASVTDIPAAGNIFLCNRCQKCKCPQGVRISHLLRYRAYALLGFNRWAKEQWISELTSIRCTSSCNACIETCPRGLHIPDLILEANKYFSNYLRESL